MTICHRTLRIWKYHFHIWLKYVTNLFLFFRLTKIVVVSTRPQQPLCKAWLTHILTIIVLSIRLRPQRLPWTLMRHPQVYSPHRYLCIFFLVFRCWSKTGTSSSSFIWYTRSMFYKKQLQETLVYFPGKIRNKNKWLKEILRNMFLMVTGQKKLLKKQYALKMLKFNK